MIHTTDRLGDSGMTTKVKAIQEIALLLPYVNWQEYQDVEGAKLHSLPIWIDDTLEELFKEIEALGKG